MIEEKMALCAGVICTLFTLLVSVPPLSVFAAGEARFFRHSRYMAEKDLARLEQLGRPEVLTSHPDSDVFELDASAVIRVNVHKLMHVSLDFDRYEEMQVPKVVRSHVISDSPADGFLIAWTRMKYGLISSFHYLQVREYLELTKHGFTGSEWTLFHPNVPSSGFRDSPLFDAFDGSWYIEPLQAVPPEGNQPVRIYVRYFIRGDFKWWVPSFIIRSIVSKSGILETDVIRFFEILECNARPEGKPAQCKSG